MPLQLVVRTILEGETGPSNCACLSRDQVDELLESARQDPAINRVHGWALEEWAITSNEKRDQIWRRCRDFFAQELDPQFHGRTDLNDEWVHRHLKPRYQKMWPAFKSWIEKLERQEIMIRNKTNLIMKRRNNSVGRRIEVTKNAHLMLQRL